MRCAAGIALGLLAGCAGYAPTGVTSGQSAEDVARLMGPPTGRYPLASGGQRLEYARGPYGKHTYMIDVDPAGRVTGWDQVLTELNFNSLPAGMTRDEVLVRIGRPSERYYIGWQERDIWAYRYTDQRVPVVHGLDRARGPRGRHGLWHRLALRSRKRQGTQVMCAGRP